MPLAAVSRGAPWHGRLNRVGAAARTAWGRLGRCVCARVETDYVTTFEGFHRPWSYLETLVDDLVVDDVLPGSGYIASGSRAPKHYARSAIT